MANVGDKFKPGDTVPTSGIYECDGPCTPKHNSTNVKGDTFEATPCSGEHWVLKTITNP